MKIHRFEYLLAGIFLVFLSVLLRTIFYDADLFVALGLVMGIGLTILAFDKSSTRAR